MTLAVGVSKRKSIAQSQGNRRSAVSRRLFASLLAVWATMTITFFSLSLTGSPAVLLAGPTAPPGEVERISAQMGFDRPVFEQYLSFLRSLVVGDLPPSIRTGEDPFAAVFSRLSASILLGVSAIVVSTAVGLVIGYLAATQGPWITRRFPATLAATLESVPPFFFGIVLIFIFAAWLGILPTGGSGTMWHLILPVVTLSTAFVPAVARVFRVEVARQLHADHVRAALSRGLSPSRIRVRHVGANALIPTLNVIGTHGGIILGGAIVTESVFAWPGVGQLTINAIQNRDFPVVIAAVTTIAIGYVLITWIVDIVSAFLDPAGQS